MRLPGKKRLVAAARWVRSRPGSRAMVLGYHRVAEERRDPHRLCTVPSVFERQLLAIRRHGRPVRLLDLAEATAGGRPCPGAVAVTFDDGYADVLSIAKPLLERYEIPATVFVATGYIGREFCEAQTLRADQLAELIDGGLIELGAHSVTHPRLGSLPAAEQQDEIAGCKSSLEGLAGCPVDAFAYPHGDYTEITLGLAREVGYRCACTSVPDVCRAGTDPFALPRFWPEGRDAERFARWLRWWLGG